MILDNTLIDFDFIKKLEGFETIGYVPDPEGSQSGVTIASGFDLGQRKFSDIEKLPKYIRDKLEPYLGLKGKEAEKIASKLKITEAEANIINEFAKNEAITKLRTKWEKTTGTSFNNLSREQATILTSVAFQHGDLEKKAPNFWKQTTSGDWGSAYKNLLDWDDTGYGIKPGARPSKYQSRREEEVKYLLRDRVTRGLIANEYWDKNKYSTAHGRGLIADAYRTNLNW